MYEYIQFTLWLMLTVLKDGVCSCVFVCRQISANIWYMEISLWVQYALRGITNCSLPETLTSCGFYPQEPLPSPPSSQILLLSLLKHWSLQCHQAKPDSEPHLLWLPRHDLLILFSTAPWRPWASHALTLRGFMQYLLHPGWLSQAPKRSPCFTSHFLELGCQGKI